MTDFNSIIQLAAKWEGKNSLLSAPDAVPNI